MSPTLLLIAFSIVSVFSLAAQSAEVTVAPTPVGVPLQLAPGVTYQVLDVALPKGTAKAHMVAVDLKQPGVAIDLVYPGVVAQAQPLSTMADVQGAIAAVNGDFFNISATQAGITPTNASVGPAVASGEQLKGAVPTRQRFGPSLPAGVTVEDVIGVGTDGVGRVGRLVLQGTLATPYGSYPIRGWNQYAIAQGGIGVYTSKWGTVSRKRAVCGTDNRREDPCSKEYHEVTVRDGRVTAISPEPGSGAIPEGTLVLIGRDAGANTLRQLQIGDKVDVSYSLVSSEQTPFAFAVGCQPLMRDGKPIPGLDNATVAIRSAAGFSADGRTMYLIALQSNAAGMTYAQVAALLVAVGATAGVNLDGGGSSTLVIREPGAAAVSVVNKSASEQRAIPNGIGVFLRP